MVLVFLVDPFFFLFWMIFSLLISHPASSNRKCCGWVVIFFCSEMHFFSLSFVSHSPVIIIAGRTIIQQSPLLLARLQNGFVFEIGAARWSCMVGGAHCTSRPMSHRIFPSHLFLFSIQTAFNECIFYMRVVAFICFSGHGYTCWFCGEMCGGHPMV